MKWRFYPDDMTRSKNEFLVSPALFQPHLETATRRFVAKRKTVKRKEGKKARASAFTIYATFISFNNTSAEDTGITYLEKEHTARQFRARRNINKSRSLAGRPAGSSFTFRLWEFEDNGWTLKSREIKGVKRVSWKRENFGAASARSKARPLNLKWRH